MRREEEQEVRLKRAQVRGAEEKGKFVDESGEETRAPGVWHLFQLSVNTAIPTSLLPGNAAALTGCTSPPGKKRERMSSSKTSITSDESV